MFLPTRFLSRVLIVLSLTLMGTKAALAENLRVSVSIKPIHSLVSMVMGEMGEPMLIMGDGASPHGFSLKPSQRRIMAQSEVIFIIHEGMETGLTKMLENSDAKIFQIASIKELSLLTRRRDDEFISAEIGTFHRHGDHDDHHDHDHDHDHKDQHEDDDHQKLEDHDEHDHDGHGGDDGHKKTHDHDMLDSHDHYHGPGAIVDFHFWLDPLRARQTLLPIAEILGEAYPAYAPTFLANAQKAYDDLGQLHLDIHKKLNAYKGQQFIVFHDAYQYFEKRYDLKVISSILDHHDGQITPSRLLRLRHLVEDHQADCIFAEPQYSLRLVNALAMIDDIPVLELDPIGQDIPPGANLYATLMYDLADATRSCRP